ncbi:terpene cyclase/mutase family protein [Telmatocola sphagniphila]|uniref:Terpene cyclase/mutase family protein n=1 Tax=Telmatocola sphagniphila TaxID=1123043 RepID=A0A8E6BBZ5_9BACT|nr:terpene cyclase/mutase family protein [Telmatocola sphagniphila]
MQKLTADLVDGVDRLPAAFRERHINWLTANQNPDGGFSGREGGSDLYYTGFGLRSLAILQGLTPTICEKAGGFLKSKLNQPASVIDLFSLLVGSFLVRLGGYDVFAEAPADWPERVAQSLEQFRTADGGYAKTPDASYGSTYHSFLVALAIELLEKPIPNIEALVEFTRQRRRDDGGYVEIPAMRRCGTNPTAAGVGLLQIANALDDSSRNLVIDFLFRLVGEFEGGFRANDRIPTADLLSTFTASWTLAQLGAKDRIDVANVVAYAQSLESSTGGFKGGLWDTALDVEYTFYGIGVMGLFA